MSEIDNSNTAGEDEQLEPPAKPARSAISDALVIAYRETHYHVDADPALTLIVVERNQALPALYRARRVNCAAFITACNPYSRNVEIGRAHV